MIGGTYERRIRGGGMWLATLLIAGVGASVASGASSDASSHAGKGLAVVIDDPGGAFAQQNRLIAQGVTVAVAKLNAAGGIDRRRVRLVSERLDGLSAPAVQSRLRAAGPDTVLILPCDTNSQTALAKGAARYRTLMLAPCDADASVARSLPTYWPVGMAGSDEAAGLVSFLRTVGGDTTSFIVNTPGMSFSTVMAGYFRTAAQAAGLRIVGDSSIPVGLSNADVQRVAKAISAARPQAETVFSALPPPYLDRLAAGLVRDGVHAYVIGTSALDAPLTLSDPNVSALNNATFASYGFLRQTPAASSFLQAYTKRFGRPVGAFPGLGFDTIGLLRQAAGKARSTDPAAIQRALLGGIDDGGAALFARSYDSPANHNPVTTVSVEKIAYGAFVPLLTSQPAPATPAAGG